jgi:dTDP-6-deoxy-L-talose 4-dehydrogenase (NAD+)
MTAQEKIVIAVTGANGYIGSHVVNVLIDRGAEVIAVDIADENINKRAHRINMDIFSGNTDMFKLIGSPDVCLHLAWKDGFSHNSDAHLLNLSRHYEFINNLLIGGLSQIAIMGTMHEVGYYVGKVDENTPCNPISQYGIAKDTLRRSLLLKTHDQNIPVQWLRGFYIFGDDIRNHSIFTKLIQAEKAGEEFFPFTSGKNRYDFVHVDEVAEMISSCVLQKEVTGIINCCTGKPLSLAEKVETFIRDNHFKIKLKYGAFPDRPYDSPEIWGDTAKIKEILEISSHTDNPPKY